MSVASRPADSFTPGGTWTYNVAALELVEASPDPPVFEARGLGQMPRNRLNVGQRVRVIDSREEVQRLAMGHGEWAGGMAAYCGREGVIDHVFPDDDVRVR